MKFKLFTNIRLLSAVQGPSKPGLFGGKKDLSKAHQMCHGAYVHCPTESCQKPYEVGHCKRPLNYLYLPFYFFIHSSSEGWK